MEYRVYNTGDQIWLSQRYGKEDVVRILTHDGMIWSEEIEPIILKREGHEDIPIHPMDKLSGSEKSIHKIQMLFTKLILKVLA